jgi:hypothetical protein
MEQHIGVAMPVMQSPQTPPQKMGTQKLFSFVFGGELVVGNQAITPIPGQ